MELQTCVFACSREGLIPPTPPRSRPSTAELPCQLIIAPSHGVTLAHGKDLRLFFSSQRGGNNSAQGDEFRLQRCEALRVPLCLLFSTYENITWPDLFFLLIIPPPTHTHSLIPAGDTTSASPGTSCSLTPVLKSALSTNGHVSSSS